MTDSQTPNLQKAQDIAQTAQVFAIIALAGLAFTFVFSGVFPIGMLIFTDDSEWRERFTEGGLIAIRMLPIIFFYSSVEHLHKVLELYAEGDFFASSAADSVAKSGEYALKGMVAVILIVPNLTLWISQRGGGFDINLEPETIGMLAVAFFMAAVGRILSVATQLKTENEAFV